MKCAVWGKRLILLLSCFAVAVWIGYEIGGNLSQVRVVLMPRELLVAGSPGEMLRAVSAGCKQVAGGILVWYLVSLVSAGNPTMAKVLFSLCTACRGIVWGICLNMVDVLGNTLPGLVCYFVTTMLLVGFAAGNDFGVCRTTRRFLTHAGAVFALTLGLGLV